MKAKKLRSAYLLTVQNLQMQRVDLVAFVGTDHGAQQTGDAAVQSVHSMATDQNSQSMTGISVTLNLLVLTFFPSKSCLICAFVFRCDIESTSVDYVF